MNDINVLPLIYDEKKKRCNILVFKHQTAVDAVANGRVLELLKVDHRRNVMAGMRWTNAWIKEAEEPNTEFLFLVEKT